MKKIATIAFALAALPALAATTWSSVDLASLPPAARSYLRAVKVVEDTGTGTAPADPVRASQTLTCAACVAGDTAVVAGRTFTQHASLNTGAYFKTGASDTLTAVNLVAAINRFSGELGVFATNSAGVVTVTALDYGTAGNAITTTATGNITAGGATLASGANVVGLNLFGLKSIVVFCEATVGAMTAGGKLLAYGLNPVTSKYVRAPELDLVLTGLQWESWQGLQVLGDYSYVAYVPSGSGRTTSTYLVGRTVISATKVP